MVSTATMQKRALATSFVPCQNPKRLIKNLYVQSSIYRLFFSVTSEAVGRGELAIGKRFFPLVTLSGER